MTDIIIPDWDVHETGIYFIYAEEVNRVKIGRSVDISTRLADLTTSSPVELTLLAYFLAPVSAERFIHSLFDRYRVRGEWFIYSEQIRGVVKRLNTLKNACFMDCMTEHGQEDIRGSKYAGIPNANVIDSQPGQVRYK